MSLSPEGPSKISFCSEEHSLGSRYPKSSVPEGNYLPFTVPKPRKAVQSGSGLPLHPCPKADCRSSVPVPQKGFGSVQTLTLAKSLGLLVFDNYKGNVSQTLVRLGRFELKRESQQAYLCCGTKLCVYSGAAQSPFGISRLVILIPQSSTGFNQRDGEDPPQGPQGKVGPHLSPDSQQAPRLRTRHYRSERR